MNLQKRLLHPTASQAFDELPSLSAEKYRKLPRTLDEEVGAVGFTILNATNGVEKVRKVKLRIKASFAKMMETAAE